MKKRVSIIMIIILILCLTACDSKEQNQKIPEYYCQEGSLKNNNCEISLSEEPIQLCESGYNLKDGQCQKEEIIDAEEATTCEDGYKLTSDNKCISKKTYAKIKTQSCELPSNIKQGTIRVLENGSIITSSNEAYIKNGLCYTRIWQDYNAALNAYYNEVISATELTTTSSCPDGTEEIKGKCYKVSTIENGYICEKGELKKNKCYINDIKKTYNSCDNEGFIYNKESKKCEKINLTPAQEKQV